MRDQGRHYKPTGRPLDDGRSLYHVYARLEPWALGYLKLEAQHLGESYAQTVGRFLQQAVEASLNAAENPERTRQLSEEAGKAATPVKPQRGKTTD